MKLKRVDKAANNLLDIVQEGPKKCCKNDDNFNAFCTIVSNLFPNEYFYSLKNKSLEPCNAMGTID